MDGKRVVHIDYFTHNVYSSSGQLAMELKMGVGLFLSFTYGIQNWFGHELNLISLLI